MKKNRVLGFAAFVAVFMAFSVSLTSCYKEPFYRCKILVVDTNNAPIPNAQVDLTAPVVPAPDISASGTTDAQGQISFEFANEAVFNVDVVKGAQSGKGFVKLEPSEIIKETVVIQ